MLSYKEKWRKVREKNDESQTVWQQLKDEFAQRRLESAANSSSSSTSPPSSPSTPTPVGDGDGESMVTLPDDGATPCGENGETQLVAEATVETLNSEDVPQALETQATDNGQIEQTPAESDI